jgi:hypothetical protein
VASKIHHEHAVSMADTDGGTCSEGVAFARLADKEYAKTSARLIRLRCRQGSGSMSSRLLSDLSVRLHRAGQKCGY